MCGYVWCLNWGVGTEVCVVVSVVCEVRDWY